jgi:hypothetical protein
MNWATKWMKCINRCFVQSSCQSDVNNWIKGRWEMDSQTLYIFCLVGQKWRWTKNASGPTETVWDDTQKRLPNTLFRSYCGSNTRAPMTVWVKGFDLLVGNTKNWTLSLMHADACLVNKARLVWKFNVENFCATQLFPKLSTFDNTPLKLILNHQESRSIEKPQHGQISRPFWRSKPT